MNTLLWNMMSLCKLSSRALQSVQLERRELSLCCRAGEVVPDSNDPWSPTLERQQEGEAGLNWWARSSSLVQDSRHKRQRYMNTCNDVIRKAT